MNFCEIFDQMQYLIHRVVFTNGHNVLHLPEVSSQCQTVQVWPGSWL